jgi:hypothetical protein
LDKSWSGKVPCALPIDSRSRRQNELPQIRQKEMSAGDTLLRIASDTVCSGRESEELFQSGLNFYHSDA